MASGLTTVSYDYADSALHVRAGGNGIKATKRDSAESLGWDQVAVEFARRLAEILGTAEEIPVAMKWKSMRLKFSCRTGFISDIHLGAPDSKVDEVVEFLKHIQCRKLVLNGDIIDGWALKCGGRCKSRHSRVIRKVVKMTEPDHTEVIYRRANHDEIAKRFLRWPSVGSA